MRAFLHSRPGRAIIAAAVATVSAVAVGFGVTAWAGASEASSTPTPKLLGGELSRIVHTSFVNRMAPWSGEPTGSTAELFTAPSGPVAPEEASEAKAKNAALPSSTDPILPARAFVLQARNNAERNRAIRCLATAIYYEAALEDERGQRAVAQVVLNRVKDPNFPNSVCGVVYQGWERQTGCQFSFTCDGALLRGAMADLYRRAEDYARDALNGYVAAEVGTATHYHADYVYPYWAPSLNKVGQVGTHIFYRWPGLPGKPESFVARYRGVGELAFSEAVLTGRAPRALPEAAEAPVELASVSTVLAPDPTDPTKMVERVRGVLMPGGRRTATPEQVASINERLRQYEADLTPVDTLARPSTPAVSPTPTPRVPAQPAASAAAPAEPAQPAMPVTEVNKPAEPAAPAA